MKKRKMSAHLNISIAQTQKYEHRALQKKPTFIEHAKYMREALGTRRKQDTECFCIAKGRTNYAYRTR